MQNHFYKVFEHSCVAAVCENKQPCNGPPTHVFNNPNKSYKVSQNKRFQIFSPCTRHHREKFCPFVTLSAPISINTALSEKQQSTITGEIQCQH